MEYLRDLAVVVIYPRDGILYYIINDRSGENLSVSVAALVNCITRHSVLTHPSILSVLVAAKETALSKEENQRHENKVLSAAASTNNTIECVRTDL